MCPEFATFTSPSIGGDVVRERLLAWTREELKQWERSHGPTAQRRLRYGASRGSGRLEFFGCSFAGYRVKLDPRRSIDISR